MSYPATAQSTQVQVQRTDATAVQRPQAELATAAASADDEAVGMRPQPVQHAAIESDAQARPSKGEEIGEQLGGPIKGCVCATLNT